MKVVTNDFKNEITSMGREYKNKVDIYENVYLSTQDDKLILTQNDMKLIVGVSDIIEKTLNDDDLFNISLVRKCNILSTMMKEFDFESYENIRVGNVINYQFGLNIRKYVETTDATYQSGTNYYILVSSGYKLLIENEDYEVGDNITGTIYNYQESYEWLDYGKYIIYSKEFNEDTKTYSYVCYDNMLKTMVPVDDTSIIQNVTIESAINNMASRFKYNVTLDTTAYPNLIKTINEDAFTGVDITYRDVLDMICQAIGTTMIISNNNLILKGLSTTPLTTIGKSYLKDTNVRFGKKYGPINSLVLSRNDETDIELKDATSIKNNGKTIFRIKDNLILQYDDRTSYMNSIFDNIKGIEFYLNDMSSIGIMYLEPMDYYNIEVDDNIYGCLMLSDEIKVKSGLSESIYTEQPEETSDEYNTSTKTNKEITSQINQQSKNAVNSNEIIFAINNSNEEHIINNNKINMIINNNESNLRNIESYSNALSKVTGTDIYEFNYANDGLGAKKTIGFIVGDTEYTEDIVGTKDGYTGANLFSMVSVLWQAVKEIGSSGVSDIYSTIETQTNKIWIDNKPVYRIVIEGTKVSGTDFTYSLPNVDSIVSIGGIMTAQGNQYPIPNYYDNTIYSSIEYGNGSIKVHSGTSAFCNGTMKLIVEYTKTS